MPYRRLVDWLRRSTCRPIVVASYPRSGTHLLIDCLRLNFVDCRSWKFPLERVNRLYLNLADLAWKDHKLTERVARRVLSRAARPVIKTHAWPDLRADVSDRADPGPLYRDLATWLEEHATFLYVCRDGRDVMASRHLILQEGIAPAARAPLGEFIRQTPLGMSRPRAWAEHVRGWMARPRVHCVTMERLLADPAAFLREVATQYGLTLDCPADRLPARHDVAWPERFLRLLSIRPRSTAIVTRSRPVPWRSALSRADREYFHAEAGDVLIGLGYEPDDEWVDPAHTRS